MKPTALIIDDQVTIRTLLEFVLADYNVVSKENGKRALEWLYDNDLPDIIIVDLQMPEIDGHELVSILKTSGFYHNIPVVMLAGTEKSEERIKCYELGIDDFIVKPFNPAELKVRVKNVLKRVIERQNA